LSADWRDKVYIFAWKVGSSLFYHQQTKEKQPVPFQSFVWMARAEAFPSVFHGGHASPCLASLAFVFHDLKQGSEKPKMAA